MNRFEPTNISHRIWLQFPCIFFGKSSGVLYEITARSIKNSAVSPTKAKMLLKRLIYRIEAEAEEDNKGRLITISVIVRVVALFTIILIGSLFSNM